MNEPWFKDPIIIQKLTLLWDEGVLTKDIAVRLNKEFKLRITSSAVRARVRMCGLKLRAVRGPNKKPKPQAPAREPVETTRSKPSMPPIPKSRFFNLSVDKTVPSFETY